MNIKLKKALYESIMKNVAKTVKSKLNEGFEDVRNTNEVILVSLIDLDGFPNCDQTKVFDIADDADSYFASLYKELCDMNGMEEDTDELDIAFEDGYYEFPNNVKIAINEITYVH